MRLLRTAGGGAGVWSSYGAQLPRGAPEGSGRKWPSLPYHPDLTHAKTVTGRSPGASQETDLNLRGQLRPSWGMDGGHCLALSQEDANRIQIRAPARAVELEPQSLSIRAI